MKKPFLVVISILFFVLFSLSVMASFGRVIDFGSDFSHYICFQRNGLTHNFFINHTNPDAWPCGTAEITDSYIKLECISQHDGGNAGYNPCRGGTSCSRLTFDSSEAIGVYTNSVEPSWDSLGSVFRTTTYDGYTFTEYKDASFVANPITFTYYTSNNACSSARITSVSPINASTITSKIINVSLKTDISSICTYADVPGLDFDNMTSFTNTDSTSHSFMFAAPHDNTNYLFYFKCDSPEWGINENDYLLTFLVDYNNLPNITSLPPTQGREMELYTYPVTASDSDGDTLTFSDNTSLFNIHPETGLINFTPKIGENYTVKITVYDDVSASDQVFNLSIQIINNAPILDPIGNLTAIVGDPFTKTITASDPDGDTLTFSDNATFFDIDPDSGLINFVPTQNGTFRYAINVTDNNSLNPKSISESGWFYIVAPGSGGSGGGGGAANQSGSLPILLHRPDNNSIITSFPLFLEISTAHKYASCRYSLDSGSLENMLTEIEIPESEAWQVDTSSKNLEMSENLLTGTNREAIANITSLSYIDDGELDALAAGEVRNSKGIAPYEQRLYFEDPSTGYVIYKEADDDITADFLYFQTGKEIARYELEFTTHFESDVDDSTGTQTSSGDYLTDFEGVDITLFGVPFTIVRASRNGGNAGQIKLILMGNGQLDALHEGDSETYTINGKEYRLSLDFVSSTETKFTINNESTGLLASGATYKLSDGIIIGLSKIDYQDFAGGVHSAKFFLGTQKIELKDTNINNSASDNGDLKVDYGTINDAKAIIEGVDDGVTFKLDRININMSADDDFYIGAGQRLSENPELREPEVLFTQAWDIEYLGLSSSPTEKIRIKTSGFNQYELEFVDGNGNKATAPFAYTLDGTTLHFGDNDDDLIVDEHINITKDDYFIITDTLQEDGERNTYVLRYRGADKVTDDSPVLKFDDIGSGERIEKAYGQVSGNTFPLATVKLGGGNFRVYAGDVTTGADDFVIRVDLNGDGTLASSSTLVPINTNYGARIDIFNRTDNVLLNITAPHPDHYDSLKPSPLIFNAIAANAEVRLLKNQDMLHNFLSPESEDNTGYAYTSYGALVKYDTPLDDPQTLDIDYPKDQRLPQVFITQTINKTYTHFSTLSNLTNGKHLVEFNCSDQYRNSHISHLVFNVQKAPEVTSYFPEQGKLNASINVKILVNLSKSIDTSNLKESLVVSDTEGNKAKGSIEYDTILKRLTFRPFVPLKYNTTYTVNVSGKITDTFGNPMGGNVAWAFTTALKDTDNDGIPDHEDNDLDNDGVDDSLDFLLGNISNVNSDIHNLSVRIGEDDNLSNAFNGTKKIEFYAGDKKILEFDFNFSSDTPLDLTNVSVLNASNSTAGGIVVRGIKLDDSSFKKTVSFDRMNHGINGICIRDMEIEWIDEISPSCDASNEFKVECDGTNQNGYACNYNSTNSLYTVSGLSHSGVTQFAYTKPSPPSDSSSGDGGGGSGGGGGGGGALPRPSSDTNTPEQKEETPPVPPEKPSGENDADSGLSGITGAVVSDAAEPNLGTGLTISVLIIISGIFLYRKFYHKPRFRTTRR